MVVLLGEAGGVAVTVVLPGRIDDGRRTGRAIAAWRATQLEAAVFARAIDRATDEAVTSPVSARPSPIGREGR